MNLKLSLTNILFGVLLTYDKSKVPESPPDIVYTSGDKTNLFILYLDL